MDDRSEPYPPGSCRGEDFRYWWCHLLPKSGFVPQAEMCCLGKKCYQNVHVGGEAVWASFADTLVTAGAWLMLLGHPRDIVSEIDTD